MTVTPQVSDLNKLLQWTEEQEKVAVSWVTDKTESSDLADSLEAHNIEVRFCRMAAAAFLVELMKDGVDEEAPISSLYFVATMYLDGLLKHLEVEGLWNLMPKMAGVVTMIVLPKLAGIDDQSGVSRIFKYYQDTFFHQTVGGLAKAALKQPAKGFK